MAILKRAADISPTGKTLYLAKPGHGTTTQAINRVLSVQPKLAKGEKPKPPKVLVVSFGSVADYATRPETSEWDVVEVNNDVDFIQFKKDILPAARKGELKYDAVILEKANGLHTDIVRTFGDKPSQAEWNEISNLFGTTIETLSGIAPVFVTTVELLPDEEGTPKLTINRHALNGFFRLFSNKAFCEATPVYNEVGDLVDVKYSVETNKAVALAFLTRLLQTANDPE